MKSEKMNEALILPGSQYLCKSKDMNQNTHMSAKLLPAKSGRQVTVKTSKKKKFSQKVQDLMRDGKKDSWLGKGLMLPFLVGLKYMLQIY